MLLDLTLGLRTSRDIINYAACNEIYDLNIFEGNQEKISFKRYVLFKKDFFRLFPQKNLSITGHV